MVWKFGWIYHWKAKPKPNLINRWLQISWRSNENLSEQIKRIALTDALIPSKPKTPRPISTRWISLTCTWCVQNNVEWLVNLRTNNLKLRQTLSWKQSDQWNVLKCKPIKLWEVAERDYENWRFEAFNHQTNFISRGWKFQIFSSVHLHGTTWCWHIFHHEWHIKTVWEWQFKALEFESNALIASECWLKLWLVSF